MFHYVTPNLPTTKLGLYTLAPYYNWCNVTEKIEKKCIKCGITKLLEKFYKHKTNKDGRSGKCMVCVCKCSKERHATRSKECVEKEKEYVIPYYKKCKKCGATKSLEKFHKRKNSKDGRHVTCAICECERQEKYRKDNAEKIEKFHEEYRQTNSLTHKECDKCGVNKSLEEFYKSTSYKDGRHVTCAICECKHQKKYRKDNAGKIEKYYEECQKNNKATSKKCTSCNMYKLLKEFHKRKNSKDGKKYWCKTCVSENGKQYHTEHIDERKKYMKKKRISRSKEDIEKDKKYQKEYYEEHREEVAKRSLVRSRMPGRREIRNNFSKKRFKRLRKTHPLLVRATAWRNRNSRNARKKGMKFNKKYLTRERLIQWQKETPNCPICDVVIDYSLKPKHKHKRIPNKPSLDRLDSRLGYIEGNVNIVCLRSNTIKGDSTSLEIKRVIDWMIGIEKNGQPEILNIIENTNQLEKGNIYLKKAKAVKRNNKNNKHFDHKSLTDVYLVNMQLNTKRCPICDITFKFGRDNIQKCSSCDKFYPNKGYVRRNVNLICYRCNRVKSDASLKELIQMYEYLKSKGM